jgi:hypothetical protein
VSQNPYEQQFPPPAQPPYPPAQPPYPPAYPVQPLTPEQPPQPQKTNGFAIASLIFGIIGGVLLSVIFGFVALSQIKKRNERGRGMAIAGLSLSGAWVALICIGALAVALFGGKGTTTTTTGGNPTAHASTETAVKVETLRVGDCVNGLEEGDISKLPAISCSEPHEGEVVGDYQVSGSSYPGESAITDEANDKCNDILLAYSPSTKDDQSIGIYFVYPTVSSWAQGDRQVLCIAEHTQGKKTGSIKG